MRNIHTIAATAALLAAASANASIQFSFADPGNGRQLTNTAGALTSTLTYDTNEAITFIVGLDSIGGSTVAFSDARLEMNITVGQATNLGGGVYRAAISGGFRVYRQGGGDILTGSAANGNFLTFTSAGSLGTTSNLTLNYTAGAELTSLLTAIDPSYVLAPVYDAVFTITDIAVRGGGALIDPQTGVYNTFQANTSYSGTANVIPTPGSFAMAGLGLGLVAGRRRR